MRDQLPSAHRHAPGFAKAGTLVFALDCVVSADFSRIEHLEAQVVLRDGQRVTATHIDALELALRIKPSVLENRRLRWPKHMWLVHNVLGHPLMHVLALLRCYKAAFWVHDATVPKPSGQHRRFVAGNSP